MCLKCKVLCGWKASCTDSNVLVIVFCRCELLEEQLNNLTELHQNEILVLKEDLASMEEKTDYQFYDKTTHIHVSPTRIISCYTRHFDIA